MYQDCQDQDSDTPGPIQFVQDPPSKNDNEARRVEGLVNEGCQLSSAFLLSGLLAGGTGADGHRHDQVLSYYDGLEEGGRQRERPQ